MNKCMEGCLAASYCVLGDKHFSDWRDTYVHTGALFQAHQRCWQQFFSSSTSVRLSGSPERNRKGRVCWNEAGQLRYDFRGVEGISSQIRSGEWCQRITKAFQKHTRAGFERKHHLMCIRCLCYQSSCSLAVSWKSK